MEMGRFTRFLKLFRREGCGIVRFPPGDRRNGSGRSVARLARLLGVQEVASSNLAAPTIVSGVLPQSSFCRDSNRQLPVMGKFRILIALNNSDPFESATLSYRLTAAPDFVTRFLYAGRVVLVVCVN